MNLDGPVARVLIIGGADSCSPSQYRKIAGVVAQKLKCALNITQAAVHLLGTKVKGHNLAWKAQTLMQAAISHASYRFNPYKSKPKQPVSLKRVRLLANAGDQKAVRAAIKLGAASDEGLTLAKDLGNEPPNVCTPTYLLAQARKMARDKSVTLTALDEKKMLSLGMGVHVRLSGQQQPANDHPAAIRRQRRGPIALTCKGITRQPAKNSLKPPPTMDEMKFDMCGAAAVLGVTKAAIDARLPHQLVTVVAAAEKGCPAVEPAGPATLSPGIGSDHRNSQHRRGRSAGAGDALTHVQNYKPRAIIDVATPRVPASWHWAVTPADFFADDDLADAITAGERSVMQLATTPVGRVPSGFEHQFC